MRTTLLDQLTRDFLIGTSNPYNLKPNAFDQFSDLQDPTYLTFRIDFFPDGGLSMPDDAYSSGGLLRPYNSEAPGGVNAYNLYDSAAEYLSRIGAPTRQAYLEKFAYLLNALQEKAPWYFQSVTGLGELYKLDPAINFRGKDKVLTIECLESVDLRMTLLADLYRNMAFDFQWMREVLPINLRTFNMNIHVLEFRRFNTTFGIIADALGVDQGRTTTNQANQAETLNSARTKNVYSPATTLFAGTLNNVGAIANNLNNLTGGLLNGLGQPEDPNGALKSAFEAISVQTFRLKDCEFDFFSESPGYLDTVSVKDSPEANFKFKIKVGKVEKLSAYSFDKYVVAEYTKNSRINASNVPSGVTKNFSPSEPYYEQNPLKGLESEGFFGEYREAIFPTVSLGQGPADAQSAAYKKILEESSNLRRKPLERLLGGVLRNASSYVNQGLNEGLGNLTGGLLGTAPLGNVYGDPGFLRSATEALNGFLTPGNQLTTDRSSYRPPNETLKNIAFDALNLDTTKPSNNIFNGVAPITVADNVQGDNVYIGTPPIPVDQLSKTNLYEGTPPLPVDQNIDENVFSGTPPLPVDQPSKENVFTGTPPLPTDDTPGNQNVFK
jgi:hypothetical protein